VIELAGLGAFVFFAGFVDALAGGGGLITLPAYLAFGVDPTLVLGTNKLVSSIGTTAACVNYQRKHKLALGALAPAIISALIGSFIGATMAKSLDARGIRIMILCALPVVAAMIYSKRSFGNEDQSASLGGMLAKREAGLSLPIGWYDGFVGPGTGTFLALAYSRWCRYDLLGATIRAKFLNLATNLAALAAFIMAGRVDYKLGAMMAVMSVAGNWTGSHWGAKGGAKAIRPAVLLVCAGLFLKLLTDLFH
jgi:uncharacterized protein